jgi:hypothetical protein
VRYPRRVALAALAGTALIAAGGCHSSNKPADTGPGRILPTTIPLPLTPLTLATLPDPFTVPLAPAFGESAAFKIQVPESWVQDVENGADKFSIIEGGYTKAWMTVECDEPHTTDPTLPYTSYNLASQELKSLGNASQLGQGGAITPVNVNGHLGAQYSDTRDVGFGVGTTGTNVFFAEPDCAWVLRMVLGVNTLTPDRYQTLFGRIITTFEPGVKG